jgi:hypothetical protein
LAEHACKVLLGFEAAGDGYIQHAPVGGTQHLLGSLYSMPQKPLMWSLTSRITENL